MYDLSILIPSLPERYFKLCTLLRSLHQQPADLLERCQILVNIDSRKMTTGAKRNELLVSAMGRYVAFIDDDDAITEDYLSCIFEGIERGVDHVGVGMLYSPDNGSEMPVECSLRHKWGHDGTKYLRSAQHVCAIRRELALQASFPDTSWGEDKAFSERVTPLCATEYVIDHPIYIYEYRSQK